ncbi:MAG: 50S ribosomal protein L29 [Bernardetiaceae bacterium]|nr:50S ribosomal protein L29 [Bernardetiaceae bacterium]
MKPSEVRALSDEELKAQLQEHTKLLKRLEFAHALTPIENPMRIRSMRRLIARIKTEMGARSKANAKQSA